MSFLVQGGERKRVAFPVFTVLFSVGLPGLLMADPAISTDPILWLDGSDVNGDGLPDTTTDLVATWVDKSPEGNDLSADTNQPSSAADFNGTGLNAVSFSNNSLSRPGTLGLSGAPAVTVFIVADVISLIGDARFLQIGDDGLSNGGRSIAFSGDSSWRFNNGNNIFANDSMNGRGPSIAIWRSAADTNYGEKEFFLNGPTSAIDTDGPDFGGPTNITGGGAGFTTIGSGWYSQAVHTAIDATANGNYAEVLVYDVELSDQDLNAVGSYLQDKWNISNATFDPVISTPPVITGIDLTGSLLSLTWNSTPGETYTVNFSPDLLDWSGELDDSVAADTAGGQTTEAFDLTSFDLVGEGKLFLRVTRNP